MQGRCGACGATIGSSSEAGLCAACVFQLALEPEAVPEEAPPATEPAPEPPQIPGYDIHRLLGRGGMGAVWKAEQREPVRRDVAVKVIHGGFDSAEVAARFDAERQALAMMDHPNVAAFYESGTMEDGRPYFVMEYVPGVPITEFCNENGMSVEERVDLLAGVCDTVQAAHRKGIIHRDLKPSNILVLDRDGTPEPRIIDFGIAKATQPHIFAHTGMTRANQILGTPEYMSPEQMTRGEAAVDVRSDVYSLGAVLYELLSGTRPFDRSELGVGLEDVLRTVKEVDAPTPSERVTSLGPAGRDMARMRATHPAGLASKLRGELDWITMKALAKDRERRYESAAAFAEDQRRFLRKEPVAAGPPGAAYRVRKFVRRHPVGVASSAIALASLVLIAVVMTLQAGRLARERDRANDQADVSQQVTDFLVELFRVSDPSEARGNEITAREILDRGAERIREEVTDAAVRARLLAEMGVVYRNLGLRAEAGPLLEEAAALHDRAFGSDDPRTLLAKDDLAFHLNQTGRRAAAESMYTEVVDAWRRIADDEDPRALDALHNLAVVYRSQGRFEEAEELFRDVVDAHRRRGSLDEPGAMAALSNLAANYQRTHDYERAETLFEEAIERRRRVLGEDHPQTLYTQAQLGALYTFLERFAEAETLLVRTAEAQRRVVGEEHPTYWDTMGKIAQVRFQRGDHVAAAGIFAQVTRYRRETLGPEHPNTLVAMHNLAGVLSAMGRHQEADSLARETLEVRQRVLGDRHASTIFTVFLRAVIAARQVDRRGALARLRDAVDLGLAHPGALEHDAFEALRDDPEFEAIRQEADGRRATE